MTDLAEFARADRADRADHADRVHRADRADDDLRTDTLANGVRVVAIRQPQLATAHVSVFVRTGSNHESRRENGISHFVEHMAFKGTETRSCQQINLDAERLGADVNAHTDRDHTAYHMHGRARDAGRFVHMLGDIVRHGTYPEEELERERQVILHETMEDDDDALAIADRLFDKTSWGEHAVAQPIIGTRANIRRFTRAELLDYTARQYSGANVVVGVIGDVDAEALLRDAEAAFGSMRAGAENRVEPPVYEGGVAARGQPGYSQTHVVMGFPIPSLRDDGHAASVLAAAVLGEGMSSPLLDRIRERRGLVYHAACTAEVSELCGQLVIEASTSPAQLDEFFAEVRQLLAEQAEATGAVDFERARNQLAVRQLGARERPVRRLEDAALDLFVHGRIRTPAERLAQLDAVGAGDVRDAFARMLAAPATVAIAGKIRKDGADRVRALFARPLRAG